MMNYYNYFTEIEEHFVKRRGKHLLISPMDWGLIATWRDAGIPLQVALRGIDIAMDGFLARHHGSSKVNTLCYCHDSVMEEYASYLESRVGESPEKPPEERPAEEKDTAGIPAAMGLISERIGEIKALFAKQLHESTQAGVDRVLTRLGEVLENLQSAGRIDSESLERDLAIIDALLVTQLRSSIPPEQLSEWELEAKKELRVYKKKLPKETYEKIRGNYIHDKIHRRFNIGELSIFHL